MEGCHYRPYEEEPQAEPEYDPGQEVLPSGHTRQEHYDTGLSDFDIKFFGLDQAGAPVRSTQAGCGTRCGQRLDGSCAPGALAR